VHELTIAEQTVHIAISEAKDRRVTVINLVIGELSSVVEESIRFCFDAVSRGTKAESATLSLRKVVALVECSHCSFRFGLGIAGGCPRCGNLGGTVIQGRELYIESIEVED
jgi:hydrogenase nickel incorporation protein HypA/HybF